VFFAFAVIEAEVWRHEGDAVTSGSQLDNRIPHQQSTTVGWWEGWFGANEKDSQARTHRSCSPVFDVALNGWDSSGVCPPHRIVAWLSVREAGQ
jgi:hypothetical protein